MFLGVFHCLPLQAVLEMEAQRTTSPKRPIAALQVLLGAGEPPCLPLCLCAAPLSHRSNPHNPSLCPCTGHEGSLCCFSLNDCQGMIYPLSPPPSSAEHWHFITAFKGTRFSAFVVSFPWIISEFLQWLAAVAPVE